MQRYFLVIAGSLLVAFASCAGNATKLAPGNMHERAVSIETYSPENLSEIYSGNWKIKPVEITGTLYLPEGEGPFPAVILYHGSGHPKWLKPWFRDLVPELIDAGIAGFVLDSYTGRGISGTARDQTRLSKAARLVDAFQALKVLAAMPVIDPNRIGISGYSFGGIVATVSADRRLVDAGLADGHQFAGHLPVYPSCQSQFRTLNLTGAPMLFLAGEADDYTPAKYCRSYVDRLAAAGYDARIKVYPGAYHAWIADYGVARCGSCVTFTDCGPMYIEDDGHEATRDGRASTRDGWAQYVKTLLRLCGRRGTSLGINPEAREDTLTTTVAFFSSVLVENAESRTKPAGIDN